MERFRPRLELGTYGGVVAIAGPVAGLCSQLAVGGPLALPGLTVAMVLAAGIIALTRPRQVQALAVADALVGLALLIEMFSVLGVVYLAVLLLLVAATLRADEQPRPRAEPAARETPLARLVAPQVKPMLATDWEQWVERRRQAVLSRPRREPAATTGETYRRAG